MAGAADSALGAPPVAGAAVGAGVCGVAFGSSLFCPHPTTKIAVNMIRTVHTLVAFMGSSILLGWFIVCTFEYTPYAIRVPSSNCATRNMRKSRTAVAPRTVRFANLAVRVPETKDSLGHHQRF
ncbi:MAG: hypothetical protein D4R81_07590 [Nitrospiraceae bacterium]|nr:MAG: hypothetical protein D4R81_07590 [Nitrospiraceae bacterium]